LEQMVIDCTHKQIACTFPLDIVILHAIINSSSHMGDQTKQANRRMLQSGQKTLLLGARQRSLNLH
jgi:hypothetical protein